MARAMIWGLLSVLLVACTPAPAAAPVELDEAYLPSLAAIRRAEGFQRHPYLDGKAWSVGYGRNLTARGVSRREAELLLRNDVADVIQELDIVLPWWRGLDAPRRAVLIEMGYNLGTTGLLSFRRMLLCLRIDAYGCAADEALDSRWAGQVGTRATRLSRQLREGTWQ